MLVLTAALSLVMGVTLGLLGGGGSILTVPLLVYIVNVDPKEAIATSLLVVGVTSFAGMLQHARSGNVRWKTGIVFGLFAMVGAYGGGLGARYLRGDTLLLLFALLTAVTGAAMLRRKANRSAEPDEEQHRFVLWKIMAEGLVVGAVTGLVGAGGGFLVVPALVFFGGLGMRAAIGTSLLVIAMKSFAGLAGHLSHLTLDMEIAGVVTVSAVVGSLVGAGLAKRIAPQHLRRGFAWFVIAMAGFMLYKQLSVLGAETLSAVPWLPWAGGLVVVIGVAIAVAKVRAGERRSAAHRSL